MAKKIIYILTILTFEIIFLQSFSQVSTGGLPYSFSKRTTLSIPTFQLQKPDVQSLIKDDLIDEKQKDVPLRFGEPIETNISLQNSGAWTILENGDRIWMLQIEAPEAVSLNINYDKYQLPIGSKLYIYNSKHDQVLGAFTNFNNKADGKMATGILKGSSCILEYYEPKTAMNQGIIEISSIVYGYKDLFSFDRSLGSSGSCNNNINCAVGTKWQNEKRGVAMILTSNNSRKCTGTLLNNVKEDAKQFFLTANHCLGSETNWIFMFNYESPNCTPTTDGLLNQTVQGAKLKATNSLSDFALVEITETIPQSYYPYFCGWDVNDLSSDSVVCIHHPNGDVKKISFDYNSIVSSDFEGSNPPNSHWQILNWEDGTTETGSSGSPLFNKNHLIIGQLHGGNASCSNLLDDSFGKLAYSWKTTPDSNKQLKYWLDPDNSGMMSINGKYFGGLIPETDLSITEIISPKGGICPMEISPVIHIYNNGLNQITSAQIYYQIDNDPIQSYKWNGLLNFQYSTNITLPSINTETGFHQFKAYLSNLQDENRNNDTLTSHFAFSKGDFVTLSFKPDKFPEETSWILKDRQNNVISTNGLLSKLTTEITTWCLDSGCYTFIIKDTQKDGMGGADTSDAATSDDGIFSISHGGNILTSGGGKFKDSLTTTFCIELTSIDNYEEANKCMIYPNPTSDLLYIDNPSGTTNLIEITNILGEAKLKSNATKTQTIIDISGLAKGVYVVFVCDTEGKKACKILKK